MLSPHIGTVQTAERETEKRKRGREVSTWTREYVCQTVSREFRGGSTCWMLLLEEEAEQGLSIHGCALFLQWYVSDTVSDSLALISVFPVQPALMYGTVREFLECLAFSLFKMFLFPQTKEDGFNIIYLKEYLYRERQVHFYISHFKCCLIINWPSWIILLSIVSPFYLIYFLLLSTFYTFWLYFDPSSCEDYSAF